MNARQRMAAAMRLTVPDRVPVMCQLAIGHYFLYSGVEPLDIWFTSQGFAEALVRMMRRYHFDGLLINLPGRDPDWQRDVASIHKNGGETRVHWKNGCTTIVPCDDNPHYYQPDGSRFFPPFQTVDPDTLYYVEPWDTTEITYPYSWGHEKEPRPFDDFFPTFHLDTLRMVKEQVGDEVSVHVEVFSPWSQFMELLNYENALLAILDDGAKARACLARLTEGALDLACRYAAAGADALLISSAFAGAGLISRRHYEEFVLPYESQLIARFKQGFDLPVYTHTCGAIGDRLDLLLATGTNGIDTLDPPPLGSVDLVEAKRALAGRAFIKGNIDPVNTLLRGKAEAVDSDVRWRLSVAAPGGGYILSSACSIAPHTPPHNIERLVPLAETWGAY
ncbi:hypothetical protein HS125_03035 [bacterium]|nr:hypothetical protein [bacterium]